MPVWPSIATALRRCWMIAAAGAALQEVGRAASGGRGSRAGSGPGSEGGRIVAPVRNLRFTQSYLDAMAAVSAVASERKTLVGALGAIVVPAVRIDSWTFTGTTEH